MGEKKIRRGEEWKRRTEMREMRRVGEKKKREETTEVSKIERRNALRAIEE